MNLDLPNISYCIERGWVKPAAVVKSAPKRERALALRPNVRRVKAWLETHPAGATFSAADVGLEIGQLQATARAFLARGLIVLHERGHRGRAGGRGEHQPNIYRKV